MTRSSMPTKICSQCGIAKPLSAFLQMSDKTGTSYGQLCATCRKTNLENANNTTEVDETHRLTSGKKIDAKAKLQQDIEKRQAHEAQEESYREEREKLEENISEQDSKTQDIAKHQKAHRETFLNRRSVLTGKSDALKDNKSKQTSEAAILKTINKETSKHQEQAVKDEHALKSIDLSGTYIPPQTGAQIKMQGESFNRLVTMLGTSAPIFLRSTLLGNKPSASNPATPAVKNATDAPNKTAGKETLTEFIEKSWGPGKKR